jgi:integrase/recombinase XerD
MKWIDDFRRALELDDKSNNTKDSYCSDIQEFLKWFVDTYLKEFDGQILEQDAREFKSYLLNIRKLKPASINRKLGALRSFNSHLISIGTGRDISISSSAIPDSSDRDIQAMEKNELNRFRRAVYAADNKRDIAIVEVLNNTGIRVSELVALEITDIHLTERNGSTNYSYIVVRSGKGDKYREMPLNSSARKALQEYLEIRVSHSNKVFVGQRGPLRRESIDKIIKKYCYQADIENISSHTLRHTFCTRLMQEGTPIPIVSKLAGHSSIQTTMNFYIHVTRKDKIYAVEKLY